MIVFFVGGGHGFKVFRFKHLVAIQAPDIVDPVAPRQDFGFGMLTDLHRRSEDYPYSKGTDFFVKPLP